MNILNHKAPGLVNDLRSLTIDQRRRALTRAAIIISRQIIDLDPQIYELLEYAKINNTLSPKQIAQAYMCAEYADNQYLVLQGEGVLQTIWKNWFAQSRLATGIANLFEDDSLERTSDATYELCCALDNKQATIDLIQGQIEEEKKR